MAANNASFIGDDLVLFLNDLKQENQRVAGACRRVDLQLLKSQPGIIVSAILDAKRITLNVINHHSHPKGTNLPTARA